MIVCEREGDRKERERGLLPRNSTPFSPGDDCGARRQRAMGQVDFWILLKLPQRILERIHAVGLHQLHNTGHAPHAVVALDAVPRGRGRGAGSVLGEHALGSLRHVADGLVVQGAAMRNGAAWGGAAHAGTCATFFPSDSRILLARTRVQR